MMSTRRAQQKCPAAFTDLAKKVPVSAPDVVVHGGQASERRESQLVAKVKSVLARGIRAWQGDLVSMTVSRRRRLEPGVAVVRQGVGIREIRIAVGAFRVRTGPTGSPESESRVDCSKMQQRPALQLVKGPCCGERTRQLVKRIRQWQRPQTCPLTLLIP
jgi:hypothetical protein